MLKIINTRDISQIKLLKGVGVKKAESIISSLEAADSSSTSSSGDATRKDEAEGGGEGDYGDEGEGDGSESPSEEELHKVMRVMSLDQLAQMKGVGAKTVERMRLGVGA